MCGFMYFSLVHIAIGRQKDTLPLEVRCNECVMWMSNVGVTQNHTHTRTHTDRGSLTMRGHLLSRNWPKKKITKWQSDCVFVWSSIVCCFPHNCPCASVCTLVHECFWRLVVGEQQLFKMSLLCPLLCMWNPVCLTFTPDVHDISFTRVGQMCRPTTWDYTHTYILN